MKRTANISRSSFNVKLIISSKNVGDVRNVDPCFVCYAYMYPGRDSIMYEVVENDDNNDSDILLGTGIRVIQL